ncbi:MAG: hypothetical protein H6835_08700 [Planctomycetes bacterium]|nr:hypothetical protein [Planctomycetota bacterium]
MRPSLAAALLLAAAMVFSPAGHAQNIVVAGNTRHADVAATARGLTLPAGTFTVTELIDAVAGYLCRIYVYDLDDVEQRATFTLQRALSLDALGSEEMLYALLAARNLAALPLDELRGVYQIIALDAQRPTTPIGTVPWRRPQDILLRPHLRELVLTAVPLEHLDAAQVAQALRAQFVLQQTWQPGTPTVSSIGAHGLVLHGYSDLLAQTIRVLHDLDRAFAPPPPPSPPAVPADVLRRLDALEHEVQELRRQLADRPTK